MLTMQFLIVLTLFAVQSLAKPNIYKDFVDYAAFDYLNDPNHEPTEVKPECKIDLLIIWDNSRSIGKTAFDKEVKDFFRSLINNEYLNVGPEGTHLSIITFSTQDRTKVLLKFGEKTTKAELLEYINGLHWSEVEGDATRTGRAFMIANQIFNQKSPLNGRATVQDVAMALTDGKPIRDRGNPTYGFYDYDNKPEEYASKRRSQGEIKMANAYSAKLREKEIRFVGVYIGNNGDPKLLEKWTTTPSDAIQTDKAEFDKVVSTMVDKSCKKPDCKKDPKNPECIKPGNCECARTTAVKYVKSGESSGEVYWKKPSLSCSANPPVIKEVVVNPPRTESPKVFDVGNHVISYIYKYQNGRNSYLTHTCYLSVQVKVCDCPSKDLGVFYTRPNDPTCPADFEVPKPNCPGLNSASMSTSGVYDSYQIGKHTPTYSYVMSNGRKVDCHLNFDVKVIPCSGKNYNPDKEVCCEGQLHTKQSQWECCGMNYFNKADQKCCSEYGNVVSDTAECPNACEKR